MTRRVGVYLILASLVIACWSTPAHAQQPPKKEKTVTLDFVNVKLETFVQWVSQLTKKRFLYSQDLQAKMVFLLSPTKVKESQIYAIFQQVMAHNGFALFPSTDKDGAVIRIVDTGNAKWQPATIISLSELEKIGEYRYVTQVIPLKHITARAANNALRIARLADPRAGLVVGLDDSNTLLLTGFAPNIRRIYEVIKLMDIPGPKLGTERILLKWATPEYLVPKLQELVKAGGKPSRARGASTVGQGVDRSFVNLVADQRTNAIILQAYPERMKELRVLIAKMDIEPVGDEGGIHIYQLKHHNAADLEEVLTKLIQGKGLQQRPRAGRPTAGSGSSSDSGPQITVVADKHNNSLVVTASPAEWREIRGILVELDQRRPQVLIEVAIVEMSPSAAMRIGVEVGTTDTAQKGIRGFGSTNFGLSQLVSADGSPVDTFGPDAPVRVPFLPVGAGTGFLARSRNLRIGDEDRSIFTIPVILQMLKQDVKIDVLSMPRLLTNDNETAHIKVTEADPVIKQETTTSGSTVNSFDGFEEAGTELTITPHISTDNYLRLEILQKLEVFRGAAPVAGLPRAKVSRELKSSITIPDGQTVVLGGLVRSEETETVRKIPFLGDIPIIGFLFRRTDTTVSKTRLYLFITPHILKEKDFRDLARISYEHKLEAYKLGGKIGRFDKRFVEYQRRLSEAPGARGLPPMFQLKYKSPTDK